MKKYSRELNYLNAISCICVILIHVLSSGISGLRKDSIELLIIYFPWKIAAYVVPCFLFTGAIKMCFSFEAKESYFKYIYKRFFKIFVPYCIWVVIYFIYFAKIGWVEKSLSALLRYIIVGDLSAQFYYVIVVMQFYLLAPLWKWVVNKIPHYIAIPTSVLITMFMYHFDSFLYSFGIQFEHRSRLFVTYLAFFVIGLYVGKQYDAFKESLVKNKGYVISAFIPVLLVSIFSYIQFTKGLYLIDGDVLKFFTDLLSIFILLTLCILIENSKSVISDIIKRILTFIHNASFSVFLSHCLVLQIITNLLVGKGINDNFILLLSRAVATYTIPFAIWYIWNILKKSLKKS